LKKNVRAPLRLYPFGSRFQEQIIAGEANASGRDRSASHIEQLRGRTRREELGGLPTARRLVFD